MVKAAENMNTNSGILKTIKLNYVSRFFSSSFISGISFSVGGAKFPCSSNSSSNSGLWVNTNFWAHKFMPTSCLHSLFK
ncbi:MAG: hypothetical protein CVT98_00925 [Bacteroidetes bacterium HGW-Bacteroidetes-15]|nr:MAG: hypothetical protein CVT98_00925 [Bacteroidetes bacterium HGW-Bacteroidetes-15]